MATLKEIRYSIKEALAIYNEDSNVSNEYIDYKIHTTRAMLLAQRFSSRSFVIPNAIIQHFYHDLSLAEDNEFVDGIGTVLATTTAIQTPLEPFNLKNNIRITSGSYSDISFAFIDTNRFSYVGHNKWLQNIIYCAIGTDWKIYFTSSNPKVKMLEQVKVSMVCANPETAYPYTIGYDVLVDFDETEYPLNSELIVELTDIIIKQLTINLTAKEDKVNDATDNGDR